MTPSKHTMKEGRHVVISENAESQIRYLETHFKRDRWEATVLLRGDEASQAPLLSDALRGKGYVPEIRTNEAGDTEIHFVHQGAHEGLVQSIKDAGLMRGTLHFLKHTPTHLADLVDGAESLVKYTADDSARLMSGLYLAGDVIQTANGFGGTPMPGESRMHAFLRPENSLNSLAFAISTVQSLLLIQYAKESHELLRDQLDDARDAAISEGRDPLDLSQWSTSDKPLSNGVGMFGKFDQWARENPITMASSAMITACAIFAAASGFQLKRANRSLKGVAEYPLGLEKAKEMRDGALWNFGFSGSSTLTWLYFMSDKKEYPDHDRWYEGNQIANPAQWYRESRMNPSQTGSILGAVGSGFGLKGALESGNAVQGLGQCVYLLGDAMMFITEKKEYGKESAGEASEMAKAAAQFISRGPLVLGQAECDDYVSQLADYVAKKQSSESRVQSSEEAIGNRQSEMNVSASASVDAPLQSAKPLGSSRSAEARSGSEQNKVKLLKFEIMEQLGGCYHPLVKIAEKAVPLLQAYPLEQRVAAREGLIDGLMAMPNIYVSRDELSHALNYAMAQQDKKVKVEIFTPSAENPTPEHYTERLIHAIPGQCDAANALILKEAMGKALFRESSEFRVQSSEEGKLHNVAPTPRVQHVSEMQKIAQEEMAMVRFNY